MTSDEQYMEAVQSLVFPPRLLLASPEGRRLHRRLCELLLHRSVLPSVLKRLDTHVPVGGGPASATTGLTTALRRPGFQFIAEYVPPTGVFFPRGLFFFTHNMGVVWSKTADAASWACNSICTTPLTRRRSNMDENKSGSGSSSGGEKVLRPRNKRERLLVQQVEARMWELVYKEAYEKGFYAGRDSGQDAAQQGYAAELKGHRAAVSALHAKLTGVYAMVRGACEVMDAAGLNPGRGR